VITTTGRALIEGSLQLLGVVGDGSSMTAEQLTTGLRALNSFTDSLGTQRQSIYAVGRTVTTAASGATSYSIGLTSPASDFPQARPLWIDSAGFYDPSAVDPEVEIPLPVISDQAYQAQQVKAQTSTLPTTLYYQPTSGSAGTIILWPVLTQDVDIVLYVPTALAQFDASTSVVLPTGYDRMYRYNLARELAPYYARGAASVMAPILQIAAESLADVKRANSRISDLQVDPAILSAGRPSWNIYTGP
jgi:hypothetical protein